MNNNLEIKYKPFKHKFQIKHASYHWYFTLFYQSQPPKYFFNCKDMNNVLKEVFIIIALEFIHLFVCPLQS